jgi:hypothetical protein
MTHHENKRMANRDTSVANQDKLVAEMRAIVRRAGDPGTMNSESVKAMINRAARRLGLGYRRTRTFWYGSRCTVLAIEADQMRAAELRLLAERQSHLRLELNHVTAQLDALERSRNGAKYSAKVSTNINLAWGEMQ